VKSFPQKHHQVSTLTEIAPNDLILIPSREKTVLAAPRIEQVICNRWKINPEYKKVLS
jgi:hypothetical protein